MQPILDALCCLPRQYYRVVETLSCVCKAATGFRSQWLRFNGHVGESLYNTQVVRYTGVKKIVETISVAIGDRVFIMINMDDARGNVIIFTLGGNDCVVYFCGRRINGIDIDGIAYYGLTNIPKWREDARSAWQSIRAIGIPTVDPKKLARTYTAALRLDEFFTLNL